MQIIQSVFNAEPCVSVFLYGISELLNLSACEKCEITDFSYFVSPQDFAEFLRIGSYMEPYISKGCIKIDRTLTNHDSYVTDGKNKFICEGIR